MDIKCSFAKMVDPQTLIIHDKNPNFHSKEQIERLAQLIKFQGARHPIIVSRKSGKIVAGHGRLMAMKQLGWKQVPVDYQDFKSNEEEYAFLVSDNAISEWADLDLASINTEMLNFPNFDIDLLGIKDFSIVEPVVAQCDEDEIPEQVQTLSVLGDIYELGNHRLLCGDSTSIDAVEKLMAGSKADMVFTDPPYGMNLDTDFSSMNTTQDTFGKKESKKYSKVIGDAQDFDPLFILSFFNYCKEIFLWGFDYYAARLPQGTPIVWDKRTNTEQEIVNLDRMYGSSFELCWSKNKHKREIARVKYSGVFGTETQDQKKRIHPTQKPIQLVEFFIDKWGKDISIIVDLFGGSGSTLIACEKTNRKCYMMELDPHYIDVIVSRYCKYTGNNKIKRNGEEIEWQLQN